MKKILLFAASLAAFCGCTTVTVSKEGGHTMVVVENSGWRLFNFIPTASGNPDRPNEVSCRLFTDTVSVENNMKVLERTMREEGAVDYRDVVTYTTEESIFVILVKRYYCHTTAQLVMPEAEKTAAEDSPREEDGTAK